MPTKYSKINFIYFMQKWMDSVPGQTFLNYAYSWGAAVVILGTLFKLTHLPGANLMLFIGMGTEVFVFFISAFDRPFDKSTIDMTLDNHMADEVIEEVTNDPFAEPQPVLQPVQHTVGQTIEQPVQQTVGQPVVSSSPVVAGGTIIIGNGAPNLNVGDSAEEERKPAEPIKFSEAETETTVGDETSAHVATPKIVGAPAPAVSVATAEAMEAATTAYVERLEQLNETLQKVEQLSSRLATDSEEMENLNRTLTGIARVYEMQLKSASQQITTQDSINEQTQIMADKIKELNSIYARMIEAMTTNMPKA